MQTSCPRPTNNLRMPRTSLLTASAEVSVGVRIAMRVIACCLGDQCGACARPRHSSSVHKDNDSCDWSIDLLLRFELRGRDEVSKLPGSKSLVIPKEASSSELESDSCA